MCYFKNMVEQDAGGKFNFSFSNPKEIINFFTSKNADYSELYEVANSLLPQIEVLHTNLAGNKFQVISQCILEAYKRIYNFKSTAWISQKKLDYELKEGQKFIFFDRISSRNEVCQYIIANQDQVNFDAPFADIEKTVDPHKSSKNKAKTQVVRVKEEEKKVENPQIILEENKDLKKINDFILNGDNVFITGFAGTGKSYILNKLKERYKKKLTITSTTGIAAVNVKGQTLHSWAGVGLCRNPINVTVDKIRKRPTQLRQIVNCKILAVDEISMLNVETFEYVNAVLKQIRENDKPFGGIQVVFIGDFFQLPPVEQSDGFERRYCFETQLWEDLNLKNVVLKKNFRQNEKDFIQALSNMRINRLTESDIDLLETRCVDDNQDDVLHIFSTNDEANRYNAAKFNAIDKPIVEFKAKDGVFRGKKLEYNDFTPRESAILEIFNKNCRADRTVYLKKGCRVMLLVNMDFDRGLINGSCGVVQNINDDTINITFDNGVNTNIPMHEFEYYYNDKVVATRLQYPLKLAYGITIHKSQGMTLDKLVVDCRRVFECGQVYVAMSRVKTLEGLYLKNFDPSQVLADNKVARFYRNIEEAPALNLPDEPIFVRENNNDEYSDSKIKEIVREFVEEFSGQYGKSGICKILTGSKTVIKNNYNDKILDSKYYGIITGRTRKSVDAIITQMIEDNELLVKHVSFGRPVLYVE